MSKYSEDYIQKRKAWWIAGNKIVSQANYKKALEHGKTGVKLYPNDVVVEFRSYVIQADFYLTGKSKNNSQLKKTVSKMAICLKRMKGLPVWAKNYMKNEYYFQTKQFKKQYELGINEYEKTNDKFELYSAGVGGAQYAPELAKRGQKTRAKTWAERSIKAWGIYFEVDKRYYNSYVQLALAYGILGERKKMMRALGTSSKRSGKGSSYKEFQDVIDEVNSLGLLFL